jgi:hypothetical protein
MRIVEEELAANEGLERRATLGETNGRKKEVGSGDDCLETGRDEYEAGF